MKLTSLHLGKKRDKPEEAPAECAARRIQFVICHGNATEDSTRHMVGFLLGHSQYDAIRPLLEIRSESCAALRRFLGRVDGSAIENRTDSFKRETDERMTEVDSLINASNSGDVDLMQQILDRRSARYPGKTPQHFSEPAPATKAPQMTELDELIAATRTGDHVKAREILQQRSARRQAK